MAAFLSNLKNALIVSFVIAAILFVLCVTVWSQSIGDRYFWAFIVRWLHVASGVMWIGLLWYFNFVQTPTMPKIPDELKPAIGKHISPAALFWFRWGAMATLFFGVILAFLNNYFVEVITIGATNNFAVPGHVALGIGVWFAIVMWFNVWFIIWPNQQKVLNIGNKYPDIAPDAKAKAAKIAGLASRINTVLSFPMLFCMVAAQGLFKIS